MATVTITLSDKTEEPDTVCVIEVSTDWKDGEPASAAVTAACGLMGVLESIRDGIDKPHKAGGTD